LFVDPLTIALMAKRKREDDPGASRLRTTISGGLGKSKRVKVRQSTRVADKENITLPETKPQSKPTVKFPAWGANVPKKTITTKRKVSSRPLTSRPVLQQKSLNISAELKKHPISKHVLKPNLYNDEGWIGQQQVLMTSILNEILETHSSQNKLWKEKDLEKARAKAFEYYQGDEFQIIVRRLNSVPLLANL
jgi:hypothetical protein